MEEASTSQNSSLEASTRPYHVFINHRGPDVKYTLASTIDFCLSDKGLNVFFDNTEFRAGQILSPTIIEAIRTSSVYIAIFSPRYAESYWCLEELRLMLETGRKIIPVFYGVRPKDLRQQRDDKGIYAQAFSEFRIIDHSLISQWRQALKQASNISGLELNSEKFGGDQGKLVEAIIGQVMEYVRMASVEFPDSGLLGLKDAVKNFKAFLSECSKQNEKYVKIVGIVGVAGSGKTTLAENLYYGQRYSFNRSSFIFGVSKASKRNGLASLQRQLLKDLTNDSSVEINNVSLGKEILADRVHYLSRKRSLKFLIVIDDVDHREQLDALLLKDNALGAESCVIVTSRDKAILNLSRITLQYKMQPLSRDDARMLFSAHAFPRSEIMSGFEALVDIALEKCSGFPLFLKAMGEHLHLYGRNNKEYWKSQLEMISQVPEIVHACYGGLGDEEKQIFLDIACFFVGIERNRLIRICAGSGWRFVRALQKLEYLSLIETDEKDRVKMHESLCNLGKHMAEQQLYESPHLPNRLSRSNEAANFFGILLVLPEHTKCRVMTKPTYPGRYERGKLKIELLDVDGDLSNAKMSEQLIDLIWFRWKNCPRKSIPFVEMKNLRVLELVEGKLKRLWDPSPTFEFPAQLRELNVVKCRQFAAMPPGIESLECLEKITLDKNLSLKKLPKQFCQLKSLVYLKLRKCEGLTSLPDCFGQLTNLQHLDLSGSQHLSSLPASFGLLIQLKTLDVRNCRNLIIQEDIFGEIKTIEELNFENCKNLRRLPTQTTLQGSLVKLNLLGTKLEVFPENIAQLTSLQELQVGSSSLSMIPFSILENLPSLKEIQFFKCERIQSYPNSIGRLLLHDIKMTGAKIYSEHHSFQVRTTDASYLSSDMPLMDAPSTSRVQPLA
ncbi:hypothetical protein SUGI_0689260 [Cryptomeria japonica]|nr:hypothetical protein SUGI_0689260 [Cryptomeria japonica]